jgi:DNA invertase Pin-like site-specific DNA recombinase
LDAAAAPYLDRFGRDTIEGRLAYKRIKQAGGRLVCVSDGIDSDREGDETIFQVRMVFAEDYLRRVNANFLARIDRTADRGAHNVTQVVYLDAIFIGWTRRHARV